MDRSRKLVYLLALLDKEAGQVLWDYSAETREFAEGNGQGPQGAIRRGQSSGQIPNRGEEPKTSAWRNASELTFGYSATRCLGTIRIGPKS